VKYDEAAFQAAGFSCRLAGDVLYVRHPEYRDEIGVHMRADGDLDLLPERSAEHRWIMNALKAPMNVPDNLQGNFSYTPRTFGN